MRDDSKHAECCAFKYSNSLDDQTEGPPRLLYYYTRAVCCKYNGGLLGVRMFPMEPKAGESKEAEGLPNTGWAS